jgi:hypothetical protein
MDVRRCRAYGRKNGYKESYWYPRLTRIYTRPVGVFEKLVLCYFQHAASPETVMPISEKSASI